MKRLSPSLVFVFFAGLTVGATGCPSDVDEPSACEEVYACIIEGGCRQPGTTAEYRALIECEDSGVPLEECADLQNAYDALFDDYLPECQDPCLAGYDFFEVKAALNEASNCLSWQLTPKDELEWYSPEVVTGWEAGCSWTCE